MAENEGSIENFLLGKLKPRLYLTTALLVLVRTDLMKIRDRENHDLNGQVLFKSTALKRYFPQ